MSSTLPSDDDLRGAARADVVAIAEEQGVTSCEALIAAQPLLCDMVAARQVRTAIAAAPARSRASAHAPRARHAPRAHTRAAPPRLACVADALAPRVSHWMGRCDHLTRPLIGQYRAIMASDWLQGWTCQ